MYCKRLNLHVVESSGSRNGRLSIRNSFRDVISRCIKLADRRLQVCGAERASFERAGPSKAK